jgi:hypothetical protein
MKFILTIIFLFLTINTFAPATHSIFIPVPVEINPWLDLWKAACTVESESNPSKINIREGAYGIVQIRQCKLDEFNQATSKNYLITTVLDESISREIFLHHCSSCKSEEEAARKWNGGPRGMDKPQTRFYWQRIRMAMENV